VEKTILIIEGMSCEGCVSRVKSSLLQLPGVENVEIDLNTGQAIILSSGEIDLKAFEDAVKKTGYSLRGGEQNG